MEKRVTYYLIRFHFEDGTTEDYFETSSKRQAERMIQRIEEDHPEWYPKIIITTKMEKDYE